MNTNERTTHIYLHRPPNMKWKTNFNHDYSKEVEVATDLIFPDNVKQIMFSPNQQDVYQEGKYNNWREHLFLMKCRGRFAKEVVLA